MAVYFNKVPTQWPKVLGVDIEASGVKYPPKMKAGLDPHLCTFLSIAFSDGVDVWIFLDFHDLTQVYDVLLDKTVLKVYHNAVYDLAVTKRVFGIMPNNVFDTMVAEQILLAGHFTFFDLYNVLARQLGVVIGKEVREEFFQHPGFRKQPITVEQTEYIIDDVLFLPALYRKQLQEIGKAALGRTAKLEMDAIYPATALKLGGLKLDVGLWKDYEIIFKREIDKHKESLKEQITSAGGEVILVPNRAGTATKEIGVENFNFNSNDQVLIVLNELFKAGGITSTDQKKVLYPLLAKSKGTPLGDFLQSLLDYRRWCGLLKWQYPKYINPVTGRIHPNWRQLGARTGRFSCAGPNLQNVTRPMEDEPNLRLLWIPDSDDYVLLRMDYSQQEVRILADLCGDEALIEACNTHDVYLAFAKMLFGKEVDKDSEERYIAKQFVLATGYGSGPETLQESFRLSLERCEEIRGMIISAYPKMAQFGSLMYNRAKTYGYVTSAIGRRRYFPGKILYTEATNTPVQSTAADMFKSALVKVHFDIQDHGLDARVWHIIHDEIVIHIHKDSAEEYFPRMKELMEQAGKEICPSVLHIAEGNICNAWSK